MNILTMCSALNNSYLGIEFEDKQTTKIIKSDENYHSLYLISEIKNLIQDFKKLDIVSVNCGMGSFTGIRVALSIAKTLCCELNIPLIPLNTTEILLKAYNKEVLIMDARRDMYYFGTKEGTQLVSKDKIFDCNNVLCDKRSLKLFKNALCFEEDEKDLAITMLDLTKEKYSLKKDFNPLKVEANYIQTPPIFG